MIKPVLPDSKIKTARKLQSLLQGWQLIEQQWVQSELVLDNLQEQARATEHCPDFQTLCKSVLPTDTADRVLPALRCKIEAAKVKTKSTRAGILAELEAHQKKFYQLRQEVERSLQEITSMPANLCKTQSAHFGWDEIIRWTIDLHASLLASIEAKRADTPFDSPPLIDSVMERLDCLKYIL